MTTSAFRKYVNNYNAVVLIALFGSAVVFSLIWLYVKQSRQEDPSELLLQYAMVSIIAIVVYVTQSLLFEVIQDRPGLPAYLKTVRSELKVMGITLNDLHNDPSNIELIKKKLLEKKSFLFLFSTQKSFQFLLLDPSSIPFHFRSKDEEKEKSILRLECAKTIKHLEDLIGFIEKNQKQCPNCTVSFKFYKSMPTHSLIITDTLVTIGPYLVKMAGTKSKWIRITQYPAIKQFVDEFDVIWKYRSFTKNEMRYNIYNRELFLLSEHLNDKEIIEFLGSHPLLTDDEYNELILIAKKTTMIE